MSVPSSHSHPCCCGESCTCTLLHVPGYNQLSLPKLHALVRTVWAEGGRERPLPASQGQLRLALQVHVMLVNVNHNLC